MVRIRRFGIIRTANTVAAIYAVIVLVFVVIFALVALAGVAVLPRGSGAAAGAGAIGILVGGLLLTGIYTIFGWIFTAIACALYNGVAGRVGGIEIQIESTTPGAPGGGYPAYGYPTYGAPTSYPTAPGQLPPPPAR